VVPGTAVCYHESGNLDLTCPTCSSTNRFAWRGYRARITGEEGNTGDPHAAERVNPLG
jgi:hypothetical protein